MIKLGKTYGNLMVDVQTGSEKLKDRARRIIVVRDRPRLRRGRCPAEAREVEREGRHRDAASADLTLPQALRRLKKANDSVREAIGEDAEPTGCATWIKRRRPRSLCRRRLVQHDVDIVVQLQKRARQLRRDRTVDHAFDASPPSRPGREQHDLARVQDRRHPHRQRLARHLRRISPKQRRVAAARFRLERDPVRPRLQRRRRLVEPDVAVGADAEHLQIDPAGLRDLAS